MEPNFLVIGAMKCATTTLCHHLSKHPDVFVSANKEPEFFCKDEMYMRGMDWYRTLFEGSEGCLARGEGSTSYTKRAHFPKAAERIADALPDARLIYIVRHPLKRIESQWMHYIIHGHTRTEDFNRAVCERSDLVDPSLYHHQLSIYRDLFPSEHIKVLYFEDFTTSLDSTLQTCFEFLGVRSWTPESDESEIHNHSVERTYDGQILRFLKRTGAIRMSAAIPQRFRRSMGCVLQKRIRGRPRWNQSTKDFVLAKVRPDAELFLAENGKPTDYWTFDD